MILADNLRRLRLARGMTQSALADVLGVSDRAVSRWERGTAAPDVALLPLLAMTLETSVDALLGIDPLRTEQAVLEATQACTRLLNAGDAPAAVMLLREKSGQYPGQPELMAYLARALLALQTADAAQEALALCRAAEASNRSMRLSTAFGCKQTMAYALSRLGRPEEAARLAEDELPAIWVCRELVLPRVAHKERALTLRRGNIALFSQLLTAALHRLARDTGEEQYAAAAQAVLQATENLP